ncbi:MAG: hypothetical protein EX263_08705 [Flavobacteriaceae bacterium]|nr:MAG: hypothetical protein EX263_08705 [Flavobacteriaceae bacterium]
MQVDLNIKGEKPSLLSKVMVSILFAGFIAYVIYLIRVKVQIDEMDVIYIVIYIIFLFALTMLIALSRMAVHHIQFDFKAMKFRHTYDIGIMHYKKSWRHLNRVKYISVFKVANTYELNMWHEYNNRTSLMAVLNYNHAMQNAYAIAEKLDTRILDATKKEGQNWVDKDALGRSLEANE